ncbi:hypothetical protein GH714_012174 [Hevea brasiliensis]|uniref:Helicase C-terminal domain-containing protein n=1 Tax=Hevea brasiliensis TaxID=3981 RepID=A0A6A6L663_HEVBR|nr:hypothetical protein GH714_012174 [Hevea brasiliensis]
MLPLLQRGIAVHHSGLLPVIKELVELLFQEGLVKALFATETFAMGLNMPAKTVVFTAVKKWDGDSHRYIGSGEYIQMSGRAGRRGKDERGICIIMVDERMEMNTLKDMVLGKPAPLVSTFRLSYYSILNLMRRAEGQFTAEHVIKNSFHQFQYEKALPGIGKKVSKLEEEAAVLDASGEAEVAEYHKLKLEMAQLEKKMMAEITRPERVLYYLCTGRLIKVREGGTDWGWGVVVNVVKKPATGLGTLPSRGAGYIVDTLLHCSPGSSESGSRPRPCPPQPGEKGEMHVVPVQLPLISALSKVRISVPSDLRPLEARQSILLAVQELGTRFPEDMKIEDPEIVDLVNQIEELERKLRAHPLHKSQDVNQIRNFERKAEVNHEIQQLKSKMRDSQLQKFRDELKNRSRVLKRLGHIDADGVVQLKGRAACLIDTGDELLVTELMFNGTFNDLDHHQVAALASCFIPVDKSSEQIHLRSELAKPLQQLKRIQYECKLDLNVDEYVESTVRPYLMDVIYCWSKGASFADVIQMTDIFEGSIIRSARRLDEFLNQLCAAAQAVGEVSLEKKLQQRVKACAEVLCLPILFIYVEEVELDNDQDMNEEGVGPLANIDAIEKGPLTGILMAAHRLLNMDMKRRLEANDIAGIMPAKSIRSKLPFVTIVGVNNHGQSILLECALISREDANTFKWLFTTWLEAIGDVHPNAILTNQCESMRKAIREVMPNTRHIFCLWHILCKVPKKFKGVIDYDSICLEFKAVIYDSLTIEMFERNWNEFVVKHELERNEWLSKLYVDREYWVPIDLNHTFWARMV